ncbi:hypothetical protein B0H14DRAFT_206801 [Mycena olivaceomarginata]|nr:hypothetical protein B0H14DRAFT_206801 [Mycena olivaceomarginata]
MLPSTVPHPLFQAAQARGRMRMPPQHVRPSPCCEYFGLIDCDLHVGRASHVWGTDTSFDGAARRQRPLSQNGRAEMAYCTGGNADARLRHEPSLSEHCQANLLPTCFIPFSQTGLPHYKPLSLPTPAPYHPVLTVSQITAPFSTQRASLKTFPKMLSDCRRIGGFLHSTCPLPCAHARCSATSPSPSSTLPCVVAFNDASFQDHTVSFPTSATPPFLSG